MVKRSFLLLTTACLLLAGCGSANPAIELGGEWFLNNQDPDAFLYYQYDASKDEHGDTHHSMREMGSLWSLTLLAEYLEDDRYWEAAQRGYDYFADTYVYDEESDFTYINITPSKIKLGYNAFAILTLLELPEVEGRDETLRRLANGILHQQQEDGELKTFYFSERATGVDYYPGEALLALVALYEETGDEQYLDAVELAFPWYRSYWLNNPNSAFIPWQTQAYVRYLEHRENQEMVDFVFLMSDYMLESYAADHYCGQFDHESIVTAVYVEGINKAYELAKEHGENDRRQCYGRFIESGLELVISLQWTEEEPLSAYGGFVGSEGGTTMQVDRNQHAVMALMGAKELGLVD